MLSDCCYCLHNNSSQATKNTNFIRFHHPELSEKVVVLFLLFIAYVCYFTPKATVRQAQSGLQQFGKIIVVVIHK